MRADWRQDQNLTVGLDQKLCACLRFWPKADITDIRPGNTFSFATVEIRSPKDRCEVPLRRSFYWCPCCP